MNWKFWERWFEERNEQGEILASETHLSLKESKSAKLFLAIARKYAGDFALIPENLDIDRHIEQFPLTNYEFRKKRETVSADDGSYMSRTEKTVYCKIICLNQGTDCRFRSFEQA